MAEYIQVGVTALRDPATGELLPAVPLYVRRDQVTEREAAMMDAGADRAAETLAAAMRKYVRGCREAGVPI